MTHSNILTGLVTAFLLNACGGGGPHVDCIGCFPSVPPVTLSVDAGPDQTVIEGDSVKLEGRATAALNCYVDFEWSQTSGPNVQIYGSRNPNIIFVTPPVTDGSPLIFQLKATCRDGSADFDSVTVFVEPTSVSALCFQAPMFATTYAWTNSGCTTDSADIAGDSRIATIYRQGEAEPNDSFQSANSLSFPTRLATERVAIDLAGFVSGMEGPISDFEDFFIFAPPQTGTYDIFLCNDPLVCTRGTVSDRWVLELRDQNFDPFASTHRNEVKELKLRVSLEAGLPYYLWIHVFDASSSTWDYNLTIFSASN